MTRVIEIRVWRREAAFAKENEMLTEVQLLIVATLGSVIVWLLKLAKADLASGWLTGAVYVVSLGLAYVFAPIVLPQVPVCGEVSTCVSLYLNWAGELVIVLSTFVGFATLVYNALLKQILDTYVKPFFARFKK